MSNAMTILLRQRLEEANIQVRRYIERLRRRVLELERENAVLKQKLSETESWYNQPGRTNYGG